MHVQEWRKWLTSQRVTLTRGDANTLQPSATQLDSCTREEKWKGKTICSQEGNHEGIHSKTIKRRKTSISSISQRWIQWIFLKGRNCG